MKCSKCGADLSDDTKFCSYCGQKIEVTPPSVVEETESPPIPHVEKAQEGKSGKVKSDAPKSLADKGIEIWNKLSLYGKVTTVSIAVFVLLCLVALLAGKTAAVVIAIVQIAMAVASIFMHKGVIKLDQKKLWLKWLVLAVAILFTVLNVMSYSWGTKTSSTRQNPSSINQNSENTAEKIDWANITLCKVLPEPQSNMMDILYNGEDWLSVTIHDISENDFLEYVRWCKENYGFTVDCDSFEDYFYAYNQEGYCLALIYTEASKELSINLDVPMSTTENPVSTADYEIDYADAASLEKALNDGVKVNGKIVQFEVLEYKPDSILGINCWAGEHLNFISDNKLDVGAGNVIVGKVTEEPSKTLTGSWKIYYDVLSIGGEKVEDNITPITEPDEADDTSSAEITLTMGEGDFEGMNYQEAERIFREMGFTNFEYKTVDTKTESSADTICYIEITEWFIGDSNFTKGDKFDADSAVTFYTYKYTAPLPVSYSTNDLETAKKGNTGVFSYKSRGGSYDIYWIIDFDEGYVYWFTDGNGDTSCDRIAIVSGTLNDAVTITYHDGNSTWSYRLFFKWQNQPDHLVMQDNNGFTYDYYSTNLSSALSLKNARTIYDY